MPKRSTPFQSIVRLVRQHFAQPGVTVTESKMLLDADLGIEREVDIVIEGEFEGEPMVVSVEVIEHSRPASLPWIDEMLGKHRNLPTNRLLLVSKSGFTRNALARVEREAGRVQALIPEVIEDGGQLAVRRLFVETISYAPTGCNLRVRMGRDELAVVAGAPLLDVYDVDGNLLGPLSYLVQDTVNLDAVRLRLSFEAFKNPEKDQVRGFSVEVPIGSLGYHLQRSETGDLHPVEELIIWGDFAALRTEVPLTLTRLGGRVYGSGEAPIAGRSAVWVGTDDHAARSTTISWQTTDARGAVPPVEARPIHFPALLSLFPVPQPPATDEPPSSPGGESSAG
jgi:hypothetical protein